MLPQRSRRCPTTALQRQRLLRLSEEGLRLSRVVSNLFVAYHGTRPMPKGWIVAVRRRPRGSRRELWDCAIPSAKAAEKAVRRTCELADVVMITAHTPLTAAEVGLLGLQDRQIQKRPHVS